ncbi:MAG: hypothetical protein HRT45_10175 [Bdellovibrionales bacterium]|nr:hypothetical protein [Bdellovibrionales bacterium]
MRVWVAILFIGVFGLQARAESLKFLKLNMSLTIEGQPEMSREFVVQEGQTSRINMAAEGQRQVIIEFVPTAIGSRTKSVKMECKLFAETETGELKALGKPQIITKSRSPASVSAHAAGFPKMSFEFSVHEAENVALVETPDRDAFIHSHEGK